MMSVSVLVIALLIIAMDTSPDKEEVATTTSVEATNGASEKTEVTPTSVQLQRTKTKNIIEAVLGRTQSDGSKRVSSARIKNRRKKRSSGKEEETENAKDEADEADIKKKLARKESSFVITLNSEIMYEANKIVAIFCEADEGDFFLGRILDDVTSEVTMVTCSWVEKLTNVDDATDAEKEQGIEYWVESGGEDDISVACIICQVPGKLEYDVERGYYLLTKRQRKKILREKRKIDIAVGDASSEQDIVDSDDEADTNVSSSSTAQQEEEDDEEWAPVSQATATGKKRKADEAELDSDDEDEEESTKSTKRARGKSGRARTTKRGGKKGTRGGKSARGGRAGTRKRGSKTAATTKKKRRGAVIGEPHPEFAIIPKEQDTFATNSAEMYNDCCTRCSSKELIRAVLTNNETLLDTCLNDIEHVFNVNVERAPDMEKCALVYAFEQNNTAFANKIFEDIKDRSRPNSDPTDLKHKARKAQEPKSQITVYDTGSYSKYTYGGIRVRSVASGRGGTEGNNAFGYDGEAEFNTYSQDAIAEVLLSTAGVKPDTLAPFLSDEDYLYHISEHVDYAVILGNRELAAYIVTFLERKSGYGWNFLHKEALQGEDFKPKSSSSAEADKMETAADGKSEEDEVTSAESANNDNQSAANAATTHEVEGSVYTKKVKTVSVCKKPGSTSNGITPVHCACINPDARYLKELNEVKPSHTIPDNLGRKPIHFAAACSSSEPLQYLIDSGFCDKNEPDSKGNTPLIMAAIAGRAHNIPLLFTAPPVRQEEHDTKQWRQIEKSWLQKVAAMNKSGQTCMHYACHYNHVDVVAALLDAGFPINFQNRTKLTGLAVAAQQGSLECVKLLVERGADIEKVDKKKRSPLLHAVKNGHLAVASYLVHMGADPNVADSSQNSIVHYAAAYGWIHCLKYLVSVAKADPIVFNNWKLTPVGVAMMKGHINCADFLFGNASVDINIRDDSGASLVFQACSSGSTDQLKFLLERKADPNIANLQHETPLMRAAAKSDVELINLLLQHGADPNKHPENNSAMLICAKNFNIPILLALKASGGEMDVPTMAALVSNIFKNITKLKRQPHIFSAIAELESCEIFVQQLQEANSTPYIGKREIQNEKGERIVPRVTTPLLEAVYNYAKYRRTISHYNPQYPNLSDPYYERYSSTQKAAMLTDIAKNKQVRSNAIDILVRLIKLGDICLDDCHSILEDRTVVDDATGKERTEQYYVKSNQTISHNLAAGNEECFDLSLVLIPLIAKKHPNQINRVSNFGGKLTPLTTAVASNDLRMVSILLKNQANPNQAAYDGSTPLLLAIGKHNKSIVSALLDAGADLNLANTNYFSCLSSKKKSPVHVAVENYSAPVANYSATFGRFGATGSIPTFTANDAHYILVELLKRKADINQPDANGATPLFTAIQKENVQLAQMLVSNGANPHHVDAAGNSLLHTALLGASAPTIQYLLSLGIDVNIKNKEGQTAMHICVARFAVADESFDIEELLLEHKADINACDMFGRIPLHYCFYKLRSTKIYEYLLFREMNKQRKKEGITEEGETTDYYKIEKYKILSDNEIMQKLIEDERDHIYYMLNSPQSRHDPIETVSSLCATKSEIDVVDIFGRSPMHYASTRGATICALHLLKRDAVLDRLDKDSNTPLTLSLLAGHPDYAIMMFQKGATVKQPTNKKQRQSYTITHGKDQEISLTKWVDRFISCFHVTISNGWQGLGYMELDLGFPYLKAMQNAIALEKYQLVITLLKKTADNKVVCQKDNNQRTLLHLLAKNSRSISGNWGSVIAAALIKRGVCVTDKDDFGKTALHYCAINAHEELARYLISCKVPVNAKDNTGLSALYYAIKHRGIKSEMVFLLARSGADVNIDYDIQILDPTGARDEKGNVKMIKVITHPIFVAIHNNHKDVVSLLITFGANLALPNETGYSPLMFAIKTSLDNQEMIQLLLNSNADPNAVDEQGRTAVMIAIMANRLDLLSVLLIRGGVDLNAKDKKGKTALHYVVNPVPFGSYENVEMLKVLLSLGATLQADNDNHSPLYYALLQDSGRLAAVFKEHGYSVEKEFITQQKTVPMRTKTTIDWKAIRAAQQKEYNFAEDSAAMMESQKLIVKAKEPEVDSISRLQKGNCIVHYVTVDSDNKVVESDEKHTVSKDYSEDTTMTDEERKAAIAKQQADLEHRRYYDVLLTKCDVQYGNYGINNFYRMQLIFDTLKDNYILWTRWGRIGEQGQYQRTPFAKKDEAELEFAKIFKSKSGNDWALVLLDNSAFIKQAKKYKLVELDRKERNFSTVLKPFEFEDKKQCPQRSLLSNEVQDAFTAFTDVATVQQAIKAAGVDYDALPLGRLTRDTIEEGRSILRNIEAKIKEMNDFKKDTLNFDSEVFRTKLEEISQLSSTYYELIPQGKFKNSIIKPFDTVDKVRKSVSTLEQLIDLELAGRILLGAYYRMKEIHPLDYCVQVINISIEALNQNSPEFQLLEDYTLNTSDANQYFVSSIFKLHRKEEEQRIQKWKTVDNRYLLFHGSRTQNFLSILQSGLRIAPPEAPTTGWAFGKGIYFADMASKSLNYTAMPRKQSKNFCDMSPKEKRDRPRVFLLLSEVVLGNMFQVTNATYLESAVPGYHSTNALGVRGPDFTQSVVLPNGVVVPTGKPIAYPTDVQLQPHPSFPNRQLHSQRRFGANEYIVYDPSQVRIRYLVEIEYRSKGLSRKRAAVDY